ncbi:TIGR00341 family protein [Paenibacillus sp. YYML68]|uniref:TIGR00341 family protein n=1 Tax=Paenibacillus sp. YYML68 TaxID=2909250 RepID=UPI0024937E4B|nr:TIGR00341 family protein [Paenibacillus sp. YYML68]
MALQLIEAYIPEKHYASVHDKIAQFNIVSFWSKEQSDTQTLVRILVKTEDSEDVLNYFESIANLIDGFEVMLFPVQTFLKRKADNAEEELEKEKGEQLKLLRASRHELFLQIEASSKSDLTYLLFIVLSAIVVTIGLLKNSSAIIIGGMVIAPLLGPVIALAFSSILGDYQLVKQSILTVLKGIMLTIGISVALSLFLHAPLTNSEFVARTQVDLTDIVLALASGAAAALSVLKRVPSSLVGVMVAVALLPPTVVLGLSIGEMRWDSAMGALLLLLVNISSILLAGIITFTLSGINPVQYEEVRRANNSKKYSLLFILLIVLLLVVAVLYSESLIGSGSLL